MRRHIVHGHAIVSADDKIAGADGTAPPELHNEADWARFQAALDRAAVTVLGRVGHQTNPNARGRNRLVLSSGVAGIERRADAWWWNPAEIAIEAALGRAAPGGGIAAIVGGTAVFDLFLDYGYDAFDLAVVANLRLAGGRPLFSAWRDDRSAASIIGERGLIPGRPRVLDPMGPVVLTEWAEAPGPA